MVRRGWWKPTFIVPLVVFCGAHLGYDPAKVPIGGGAAVGNALIRRWMETKPFELWVLGTGEDLPFPGLKYHRVETPSARGLLTDFSVRKYARLSREFERGVVSFLSDLRRKLDPQDVLVLHNDIAEAGDFEAIAHMGFRQVAIFHVDVVDYVANIYLRGKVDAPKLAKLWRKIISLRLDRVLPDVLKLMFSKQEACARFCNLLVVPSSGMAQVLRASYPWRSEGSIAVIPWGTLQEPEPPGVDEELANLKRVYKLDGRPRDSYAFPDFPGKGAGFAFARPQNLGERSWQAANSFHLWKRCLTCTEKVTCANFSALPANCGLWRYISPGM
jgi:hypothetical protein